MAVVKVAETHDVPEGRCKRVLVKRLPITIFNCGGQFFAIEDTCSHAEASLAEGEFDQSKCTVLCPMHGATFDVRTGEALTMPAVTPVETFKVTVDGTAIMVEV